ncbi:MAG: dTDP-4-dehydrorhamnose reductase [Desulfobacterales bacterium]|nr:dTDP-4-dehydrorhamnose reductase [Desulfobacterales bacterium]
MKVVVAGSKGMLAQDLIPLVKAEHETFSFDIDEVDITNKESLFEFVSTIRPDIIINCAAYTLVDDAETHREAAFRVNAHGVQQLALACKEFGSILCHFSTDYVFDGKNTRPYRPDDEPNPISVYGESKQAGEVFVQSILNRYYLIRTSSLYGKNGNNFVYAILRLAKNNEPLRVVQDQITSPTWTVNLAQGVMQLIGSGKFGVYHLTDRTQGGISWFEFAEEILKLKGLSTKIEPTTSREFISPAKRPACSVLDTTSFTLSCGYEPMPWKESLKQFLDIINTRQLPML